MSDQKPAPSYPDHVDVIVVGSGPVGATFARVIHDANPHARIAMLEVGPVLSEKYGTHVRNLTADVRNAVRDASEGPNGWKKPSREPGADADRVVARPGVFLASESNRWKQSGQDMPGAGMSSCVGGMGAHWTCSVPRPGYGEKVDFIDEPTMDAAIVHAEQLIGSTTTGFKQSEESKFILETLGNAFNDLLAPGRPVQVLPFACNPGPDGKLNWSGVDTVLGPLATPGASERFELFADTLCRRVLIEDGKVAGVEYEHLPSGKRGTISANQVAVAADSLRTPQVLWASGVRIPAVGHYMNDQTQIMGSVALANYPSVVEEPQDAGNQMRALDRNERLNNIKASIWIPFHKDTHPFHSQIMYFDMSPIPGTGEPSTELKRVGVVYFCAKSPRFEDYVEFSDDETDVYGMPRMTVRHELTDEDRASIEQALKHQMRAITALGRVVQGAEPRVLPCGSSLHYQGSVRMGPENDGTSVCSPVSEVWGTRGLFVGGNGVIPTATACNPTLTAMAFAVLGAEEISRRIKATSV